MTLELKQYKNSFFDNSTEPYALGGVKDIGLMPKHEEYFFITIFDTRILVPEAFEYVKDRDTGTYYVRDGKWVSDNGNS